jgi:hypothetical protein
MPSSIINSDDGVISGTSGLKSVGGDDGVLVFQSKGTETARINTDKQIVAAAGTNSLPALTTTGDLNTGIFFPAADTIALTVGGVESARVVSGLLSIPANATAASAVRLYEDTDNGTNYVDVIAPSAITSNRTLTIPDETGTIITTASGSQSIPKAALPTGSVLQVVSTFKNDTFSSSSQTFIDITGFSVSITPTSATSKILVICQFLSAATGANSPRYNLVRDSTNIAQPSGGNAPSSVQLNTAGSSTSLQGCIVYLDSPATTSSTTYKLQGRTDGNSFVINRRGDDADATSVSSITVMEIAA